MIKSDLLYLTPLSKEDLDLFKEIYTDPNLMELVGDALSTITAEKIFNRSIIELNESISKYIFYVIKNNHNNEKIGIVGLFWNQTIKTSVEMGVMITKNHHRKGYAIKALNMLMKHVFAHMNVKSIVAFCHADNIMANRVSKGLGYQNMGISIDPKSQHRNIKWEITIEKFKKARKR
ncbi:MAG: GNAT family N-acetyltransferase [Alcanivoracaceae bacterium]|nr:GNAT family N-acetyltransferase [Alcanivoracaceae bacterium]